MAKNSNNTLAGEPLVNLSTTDSLFKGVAMDSNGKSISNTPIIVYAKPKTVSGSKIEWNFMPIATAKTDGLGNFNMRVAAEDYEEVYATVGSYTNQQIPIQLQNFKLPSSAILIVDIMEQSEDGHSDCGCHDHFPDRLPEMEDLIGNSKYSQDIGGSCTNFTVPNRALEEFNYFRIVRTSDPQIITPENTQRLFNLDEAIRKLNRELADLEKEMYPVMYETAGTAKKSAAGAGKDTGKEAAKGMDILSAKRQLMAQLINEKTKLISSLDDRRELTVSNMIDWDDTPTTYQNASIAHGHILEFRQVWRADGYSMGDLLYSLPLAPGQKRQIAVFDWDRTDTAMRSEEQEQRDELSNEQNRDRDISEIVSSVLNENQQANSNVKGKTTSWGVGVSVSTPTPASVGVSGSFSQSNTNMSSSASQNSSRDLSASSMQQIKDKTMQKASSVRSARSTVIQTVNQGESFNATTEVVANYNHCHAITIQYFEVLRHFAVNNELADVRECLFIPLPVTQFDDAKVIRWQDILSRALADRSLAGGFAAIERYYNANVLNLPDAYAGFPNTRYCDERMNQFSIQLDMEMYVNRPQEIYPSTVPTYSAFMAQTLGTGGASIFDVPNLRNAFEQERSNLIINFADDIANWQNTLGFINGWQEIRRRVLSANSDQRDFVFQVEMEKADWMNQYIKTLVFSCHFPQLNNLKFAVSPTNKFKIFSRKHGKDYKMNGKLGTEISIGIHNLNVSASPLTRAAFNQVEICHGSLLTPGKLPSGSFVRLKKGNMDYNSPNFKGYIFKNASNGDNIGNGEVVAISTPLNAQELENPRTNDLAKRTSLLKHLNTNLEAYHHWIFYMMSPDRRYMLLDGLKIKVPGNKIPGTNTYAPDEMRSVASVVENRIIGVVGNNMIVPVAAGYNLDPKLRWDNPNITLEDGSKVSALAYHYMPERGFKSTPFRVSVPTKGVFAEAVMGACNSCEKIDDSRFWKWEEHPLPDDPTEIGAISSNSRYNAAGNLTAKDLAAAIISQKDALEAPAPTGLNAALSTISKGDSFRDLTNLTGINELAKQGIISTNDAAKAYATNATELAKQQANLKHGDSIANKIKNSGLSKEDKDELMKEHLKKQIGVNDAKNTDEQRQNTTDKVIEKTLQSGLGKVKITNPDGSGIEAEYEGESKQNEDESPSAPMQNQLPGQAVIDSTENIDLNDPNFVQQRTAIDLALDEMKPDLDQWLQNNTNGNGGTIV